MCVENAMELSLNSDTFSNLKEDFDSILARTIGNMKMKCAEDATITLKLSVSLRENDAVIRGKQEVITMPTFKHDISSVMQVKDKKSGSLSGELELLWDGDRNEWVLKKIDNGQTTLYNEGDAEDGEVIEAEYREVDDEAPALPEAKSEDEPLDEHRKAFKWLEQFIGMSIDITESMGNYAARTEQNNIVLTSATLPGSIFYCGKDNLANHVGHNVACVGYGDEEIVNISIECEDCNEVIFGIDKYLTVDVTEEDDYEESEDEYIPDEEDAEDYDEDEPEMDEETSEEDFEEDYEYDEPDESDL